MTSVLFTLASGNNNNNNNEFKVRFGVRRRHRGPPFTLGRHQSMRQVVIQDEGERRRWVDWPGQLLPFVRPGL
jgi:hypothetical protein